MAKKTSKVEEKKKPVYPNEGEFYSGKVRDMHFLKDDLVAGECSDRVSAFDHILPKPIKHKGAVLNLLSVRDLIATKELVPNWLYEMPNARTTVGIKAKPLKVEMVVRGNLAGHAAREYAAGKRELCGVPLPEGLKEYDFFPGGPIITPTTKAPKGEKDEDISPEEILKRGLVTEEQYETMQRYTHILFDYGCMQARKQGLILLDTKYEFGLYDGAVILIDELHTPDSSRYIYLEGFKERQEKGEPQTHLSKEFLREKLMELGFQGKVGEEIPDLSDDFLESVSQKYIQLYETLTGEAFPYSEAEKAEDAGFVFKTTRLSLARQRAMRHRPRIAILMGSQSDLRIMDNAALFLETFGISYELFVLSAHRTPDDLIAYAENAYSRGIRVVIAGAGGAAHLPGMLAASTYLPVIGVPVNSSNSIKGVDSLLSINQMPTGVPVATMAIDGAENAAIFAAQILGTTDEAIAARLRQFKLDLKGKVYTMRQNTDEYYMGKNPFEHALKA